MTPKQQIYIDEMRYDISTFIVENQIPFDDLAFAKRVAVDAANATGKLHAVQRREMAGKFYVVRFVAGVTPTDWYLHMGCYGPGAILD